MHRKLRDGAIGETVELHASHSYKTAFEVAVDMHAQAADSWTIVGFELLDSSRPVFDMDPRQVEVKLLGAPGQT